MKSRVMPEQELLHEFPQIIPCNLTGAASQLTLERLPHTLNRSGRVSVPIGPHARAVTYGAMDPTMFAKSTVGWEVVTD